MSREVRYHFFNPLLYVVYGVLAGRNLEKLCGVLFCFRSRWGY